MGRRVGYGILAASVATTRETIKDLSTAWGGGVSNGQLTNVGNALTQDMPIFLHLQTFRCLIVQVNQMMATIQIVLMC